MVYNPWAPGGPMHRPDRHRVVNLPDRTTPVSLPYLEPQEPVETTPEAPVDDVHGHLNEAVHINTSERGVRYSTDSEHPNIIVKTEHEESLPYYVVYPCGPRGGVQEDAPVLGRGDDVPEALQDAGYWVK